MNDSVPLIRLLIRKLGAYLAVIAVTYVIAVAGATSAVVLSLGGMGVDVPFRVAADMLSRDLVGMADMFLPMIAFALLIAFMVTALIRRYLKPWPMALYMLAGATAVVCIHLGLNLAFGITPIAVARTLTGLLSQALAGAVGGGLYYWLSSRLTRLS